MSTPEGDVRISLTSGWEFKQYGAGGIAIWAAYAVLLFCWLAPTVMLIPLWLNLITTATAIVFIGAHRSLRLLDHTHADAADRETLSKEDAYKFPLVGSAVLFTLYVAYKFLPKDLLNRLITLYFALLGVYTMASTFSPAIAKLVPGTKKYGVAFKLPLVGDVDLRFTPAEWVALVLSSVFARYYIKTKHFLMNNMLAISFCVQGIGKLSLGSYTTAAILLVGLFAYDIFWVFGTDVMVSVAKSFDAPAKILFPQVFSPEDGPSKFALLGLGDIVIPGVFVALLWRFDAMISHANPKTCAFEKFPTPYFTSNILAYAAGLGMTVFVMFFFEAAQPALLYLVPACLLSSLGMAFFRKELKLLLSYEEKDEEAEAQAQQQQAAAASDENNKPKSD